MKGFEEIEEFGGKVKDFATSTASKANEKLDDSTTMSFIAASCPLFGFTYWAVKKIEDAIEKKKKENIIDVFPGD